ncbi:MAG: ABC transporter permease, partial [Chitinophagaceae bacterium]
MLRNYLRITLRNLVFNKWLSGLKVLGLGIGIAASLLLTVYLNWQWSFDRMHGNGDNIVRINTVQPIETSHYSYSAITASGVAVWAKNNFPEVKNYVRMARWIANDVVLRHENIVIRDESFLFVDSTFFEVFDFEFIEGDKSTALNSPNSILLTESKAKAFFGNQSALGKTILFDGRKTFLVTGVLKDVAVESHLQFSALCPMSTIQSYGMQMYQDDHFIMSSVFSYLKLEPKAGLKNLNQKLNAKFASDILKTGNKEIFALQKLHDIHLDNSVQYGLGESVSGKSIWLLFGISVLILLMSWANQVNIFTAEIFGKSKPLNVSRILGARKTDIWQQLITSASVSNILGILLGLILSQICLPVLSSVFNLPVKSLFDFRFSINSPGTYILFIIGFGIILTSFFHTFLLSSTNIIAYLSRQEKN